MKRSPTARCLARATLVVAACIAAPVVVTRAQESAPEPLDAAPSETPAFRPDVHAVECHARRERAAIAAGPDAVLLILGAGATNGFTGRVRSDDFLYVCPFEAADGAIVVYHDGADGIRHVAYTRRRMESVERWNGPRVGPGAETAARFDLHAARPVQQLASDLIALLVERPTLLVSADAPSDGAERLDALLTEVQAGLPQPRTLLRRDRGRRRGERAVEPGDAVHVLSATQLLTDLRAVKSASEITRIRRAVDATVSGLLDAGRSIQPGLGEYQIQAIVEFRCRSAGCEKQAFDSIVGSGPNSCILHYMQNRRTMAAGDLVVVDVGGEYEGYAADVTRTFPVSGEFTERQAQVYDAVLEAQRAGIAAVRPGVTLGQVHAAAKAVLAKHGLDQWFLHGTSHSVGLNVHDVWSRDRKLEIGSVLTIEPGVYIAEEELGVRIEDTVLVTADEPVVLSAGAPKDRAEIEALMAEEGPFDLTPPRED